MSPGLGYWSAPGPDEDGAQSKEDVHGDQENINEPFHRPARGQTNQGKAKGCFAQERRHDGQRPSDVPGEPENRDHGRVETVHVLAPT